MKINYAIIWSEFFMVFGVLILVLAATPGISGQVEGGVPGNDEHGISIASLPGEETFASGSDQITESGKDILKGKVFPAIVNKVAELKRNSPATDFIILIRGFTDDVGFSPEHKSIGMNNWALSASRSAAIARFLEEVDMKDGSGRPMRFPVNKLVVAGFSEYCPLDVVLDDDSPDVIEKKRARNRRVDFILLTSTVAIRELTGVKNVF